MTAEGTAAAAVTLTDLEAWKLRALTAEATAAAGVVLEAQTRQRAAVDRYKAYWGDLAAAYDLDPSANYRLDETARTLTRVDASTPPQGVPP